MYIIKNSDAGPDNEELYQYSVRTTNNDNQVMGHYYSIEDVNNWSGLEIIWGYFGWEWTDFVWNEEILKGGNLFLKIKTNTVGSIPDGNRLQHINNFLGSQDSINKIETFNNNNIISAETLNGFRSIDSNRILTCDISDWNNIENAYGMWQNITVTFANNEFNLSKATKCDYIFASDTETTINFNWNIPEAVTMNYAFYNVKGDINPLNNNLFEQNKITEFNYGFAASELKEININCTEIPLVTTAKGIFAYRIINNNNNNNIFLPNCLHLDYALQGCNLNQVDNINFTAPMLSTVAGFLKNCVPNQTTEWNALKFLTTFANIINASEYLMNIEDNSQIINFDLSSEITGTQEEILLKDFATNSNIKLKFIGYNKCNYDEFAHDAILDIVDGSNFENGRSYIDSFKNVTFVTNPSIKELDGTKDYTRVYNNCTFEQPVTINFGTTPNCYRSPLSNCVFKTNTVFNNIASLGWMFMDFSFDTVQEKFDYILSDNASDYKLPFDNLDYVGYKLFAIRENFNCKTFAEQTINVIFDADTHYQGYYFINNNYITDLSNLTLNCINIRTNEGDYTGNCTITSQSMTHTPKLRGSVTTNYYGLSIKDVPNLIQFDIDANTYNLDEIYIENNILVYPIFRNYRGKMRLLSEVIDIPTLTDSINNNNAIIYEMSIKQVVYNKLDSNTQQKLISICTTLNLIQS